MKLVTFQLQNGRPCAGALLGGGKVLDLQAAHRGRYKKRSPLLASVLAMTEGGGKALDLASSLIKRPAKDSVISGEKAKLLAPIPCPPQMRDFLCFEKHLVQAYDALSRLGPRLAVPQVW